MDLRCKWIYVGIDLHRKRSQIAALDEQGLSCSCGGSRTPRHHFAGSHRVEPPSVTIDLGDRRFVTVEFEVVPQISLEPHRAFDA
jgi:hypothetical protein